MAVVLTLVEQELITAREDGGTQAGWQNAAIGANAVNRIGEIKVWRIRLSSDTNMANYTMWINPALFVPTSFVNPLPTNAPGSNYWVGNWTNVVLGPNIFSYSSPNTNPLMGRILGVRTFNLSTTLFDVFITYIQTYDEGNYIDPTKDNNHSRLLKDHVLNPNELVKTLPSVYNDPNMEIRANIFIAGTFASSNFGQIEVKSNYKAGFYKDGTLAVPGYHVNPVWNLKVNGSTVNALNVKKDTNVTFICQPGSTVIPPTMILRVIRTDKTDNTVDFQTNYELDSNYISPASPDTVKIKGPFIGPTLVGPTYKWEFKIDKNALVLGATYRMIAVITTNNFPATYEVTSFISDDYITDAAVPFDGTGLTFFSRMTDNQTQYAGDFLKASIEERCRSRFVLNFPADQWKNDIFNRLGIVTSNDPRRYLIDISFQIRTIPFIPVGFSQPFYEIMDTRYTAKTGPTTYALKQGIDVIPGVDSLELRADWRNRYEADQVNPFTVQNGAQSAPGNSNQYWAPFTFEVEWKLKFFYDDYITPFTDEIVLIQKLQVRDYVDQTALKVQAQNPPFDNKAFWCPADTMCLEGEILDPLVIPPDNYHLMVNIDPSPGNIVTIEEAENWASLNPFVLAQLTTSKIYNEEVHFGDTTPNKGKFCIDISKLALGQDYKITVLAKKD